MTKILAIAMLIVLPVIVTGRITQESESSLNGQIPGAALKYIHIAEPVFARKGFKVSDYTVVVFEEEDTVTVFLRDPNQSPRTRGGGGLEVEISKKSKKVLRTYYSR